MTSFSRQKPLKFEKRKQKQKHTIFWNTKFYNPPKFELKKNLNFKSRSLEYNFRRKADLAFFEIPTILRFHNSAGRLGKSPPIIQYGQRLFGREISSLEVTTVAV